jgi:hypothetical protein
MTYQKILIKDIPKLKDDEVIPSLQNEILLQYERAQAYRKRINLMQGRQHEEAMHLVDRLEEERK